MRRKGHGKGPQFERECCKRLSLWLSGGKRDDLMWRTAMSGGRATMARRGGKLNLAQLGDFCSIAPESARFCSLFFCDAKFYRELDIRGMLVPGRATGVADMWRACRVEARRAKREPLLIVKENRFGAFVVLRSSGIEMFRLLPFYVAEFPLYSAFFVPFEQFLANAECP